MKTPLLTLLPIFSAGVVSAVDFKRDIAPILKAECYKCHSEEAGKEKGDFVFDNLTRFAKDIGPGRAIEPGKPEKSDFIASFLSDVEADGHMPPKKSLSPEQIKLFTDWVAEGASFDGSKPGAAPATAATPPPAPPAPAAAPAAAPSAPPAMQTWTNAEGKAIQAAMLRMEGESVVLQMANGQTYNYPLSKLSAESQELAKRGGQ